MSKLYSGSVYRARLNIGIDGSLCTVDQIRQLRLQGRGSDWRAEKFGTSDAIISIADRITDPESTGKAGVRRNGNLESIWRYRLDIPTIRCEQFDFSSLNVFVWECTEVHKHPEGVAWAKGEWSANRLVFPGCATRPVRLHQGFELNPQGLRQGGL